MNMRKSCRTGTALSIVAGMMLYAGVASADAIVDSSDLFNLNNLSGLSGGHTGGGAPETPSGPVHWDDVTHKPETAIRWPTWNEIQGKPEFEAMFLKISESPVGDCPEGEWMKGIDADGSIVCAAVPAGSGGGGEPADPSPPPPPPGGGGPHGSVGSTYYKAYTIGQGGCKSKPEYPGPVGGTLQATFGSQGTYSYEVTEALKDETFTIVLKGAGGSGDRGCGGNGGGIVFNYSPGVTGTFDILVGQGGRKNGTAAGGGSTTGGGASAIKFNGELLAIVGGGGGGTYQFNGEKRGPVSGGDGGSWNLAGGKGSGDYGGHPGANNIGGEGGRGFSGNGSAGGSYGQDGTGLNKGKGIATFTISGGGGGGYSSSNGGGGGGGYGGGGGGGYTVVGDKGDSGGGGGGGGYFNVSIPSTPMIIKGGNGRQDSNGQDGAALLYTGTIDW